MRDSGRLFAGIAIFFGLVGVVYWVLADEPAGAAFLIFTGGLGFLIAFYLLFTSKRPDADAKDAEKPLDTPALWVLPAGGGEARVVATRPGGVAGLRTARSSAAVVFGSGMLHR